MTTNKSLMVAPRQSRINSKALASVILLAIACYAGYNYWQSNYAQPAVVTETTTSAVQQAEDGIIGNIITVSIIDTGCTVNCANEVKLEVTNAHDGYVWVTDSEGDTMRCLPSVLTPGVLHPMAVPVANDGPHPGVPITFDGRSKTRQAQTTVMDSAQCQFAYTDMLYRGEHGLSATLSEDEQAQLDESERYCYNNPEDKACRFGRTARNAVRGIIDGISSND